MSMKRILVLAVVCAACLSAQGPRIGVIEVFGAKKVPREKVRAALAVTEGDFLPRSKVDTEERIEAIPGVLQAHLEAICCEEGKAVLFVGIEEKGSLHFDLNTAPALEMKLPEEIEKTWIEFITSLGTAVQRGKAEEDLTNGHSLMADEDCRKSQLRFVELADTHFDILREILKKDADEQHRGIAAYVLGYSTKKKAVLNDLQYAMRDPDPTVRNNAMRALGAIAVLASLQPELEMKVSATWFVEMLNSTYFSDRSKASILLVTLTEKRDESTMSTLRERGVPALMEMAEWRSMGHALPGFLLLGRVAGLSEEKIQEMWKNGQRDELMDKVRMGTAPKKK